MNLFYQPEISPHFQLTPDEAHHAIKVLRLQSGDELRLTDGKGLFAIARIVKISKTECFCELLEKHPVDKRNYNIHLAIAPTKNSDRMEWMVEKCVELGIDQISLMITQHSERKKTNLERLQKIAVAAMKQSQQAWLPTLHEGSFTKILEAKADQKFIAYVDATNPRLLQHVVEKNKAYLILVGPEGDFSATELQHAMEKGFQKVSLGPTRLRTETAGLAACHILNMINQ